jgi:hypothetical protein
MANFNVLKNWHLMFGLDFHDVLPPPGTAPIIPKVPHVVTPTPLIGTTLTSTYVKDVVTASWGWTMIRRTDIGPLCVHVPTAPNLLIPIIILTSGSKSHFASHQNVTSQGPMAVAVMKIVNLNLNCGGPTKMPPTPTGIVPAFTTHVSGFSWGDLAAGLIAMGIDAGVQFGLNMIFSNAKVGDAFQRMSAVLSRRIGSCLVGPMVGGRLGYGLAAQAVPTLYGFIFGSPMGYSPGWSLIGGHGGDLTSSAEDALMNYFNSPSVDQHPQTTPAPAPAAGVSPPPPAPPPPIGGR